MHTNMKRWLSLMCLLCCAMLLSGCVAGVQSSPQSGDTLPRAQVPYDAPTGEEEHVRQVTARLYLPNLSGTALIAVHQPLTISPYRWYLDDLCKALFDYAGTEAQSLPRADSLMLAGPVEISCGVATVNLSAQALALSHEQLYIVFQALHEKVSQRMASEEDDEESLSSSPN